MTSDNSILERFSKETREKVSRKKFNVPTANGYVCEDGGCLFYELLLNDGYKVDATQLRPTPDVIATHLGITASERQHNPKVITEMRSLLQLVTINDRGLLSQDYQVKAAMGEE